MTTNFIAGAYTATYNGKALGQTADGFRISHSFFKRIVTGDIGGDTPQDAIYRGRDQKVRFRLIEAEEAGILDLKDPYAATVGTPWTLGTIGLLDVRGQGGGAPVARALPLVLTAVGGTAAANDAQSTVTIPLAIIAEQFPIDILFAADLKEVPVEMRGYPNMSTGLFGSET